MTDHSAEWDSTTFSPDALADQFIRHCSQYSREWRCPAAMGEACSCGSYMAPHEFAVCLSRALHKTHVLFELGAFGSDIWVFLRSALNHAWKHIVPGGTGADEARRVASVLRMAESSPLYHHGVEMLRKLLVHRLESASQTDQESAQELGRHPCGAPFIDGGDGLTHFRMAVASTKNSWLQILEHVQKHGVEEEAVCSKCQWVAEEEMEIGRELASTP